MPTSFHGFEIREKIGSGGMSTVFKGAHQALGYEVAVKILHPALSMDQQYIARFEREAKAASGLASRNIARVIDYGEEDGAYFIVMEFIAGRNLDQLIRELRAGGDHAVPFPTEIALLILEDVAYGLQKAHEHKIIHRDIKPSNVLLSTDGEIKLVDFGLARDVRLAPGDLTQNGSVIGTPMYMSPEQAAGSRKIDERSDIFSLGVMAYELLSGEKPFQGESVSEIQEAIINRVPRPLPPEHCPLLTPEIDSFIAACLSKDPDRRFQSMQEVLDSLAACIESIEGETNLAKRRRALLSGFAADPMATAIDLRQRAISVHLRRGLLLKSMGREKLKDAERELRRVLYLDPGNRKAMDALSELELKAAALAPPAPARGSSQSSENQSTEIIEQGRPAKPEPKVSARGRAGPAGRSRAATSRRAIALYAVLIAFLGVAVTLVLRHGIPGRHADDPAKESVQAQPSVLPDDPSLAVASAESDLVPPTESDETPAVTREPGPLQPRSEPSTATDPPATPSVSPPSPAPTTPPQTGYLTLDLPESLEIYLDGRLQQSGVGLVTLEVQPNRGYQVEVRNPQAFGRAHLGSFTVEPGATRRLGRVDLAYGALTLAANAEITIRVNGVSIAESVREITGLRIGAGGHELSVAAPEGYRVERAFFRTADGGRIPLEPVGGDATASRYRIEVPAGGELTLGFIVR